jgi:GDP-L-fucose synthase
MINHNSKIYIAGHNGMVGSAINRLLVKKGFTNIVTKTSKQLDLRNQQTVNQFFELEKPQIVIDAAAKVGGILANNNYPYQFLMDNMLIQNNLIQAAHENETDKFIFLGSSCIYPKMAPQPLKEEYLLTSSLEPTNEWYAIAKITGVKLCEAIRKQFNKDFVSLMPTNLYGPFDNFDLETSHVLPAMIRKFHNATLRPIAIGQAQIENNSKSTIHSEPVESSEPVELWGSGKPMREFLHVEDMAKAVLFAVENILPEYLYNVGSGKDLTIKQLAETIQHIVGHKGEIFWDTTKPDGTPRKLMDNSKMENLGWKAEITLEDGIKQTYQWFLENKDKVKEVKM